jgi:MoaA/NifB/PqqE/SkfB family radical SAM enzyme
MTFDEFKTIFDKMPKTLTQIAFGIMDISTNPDFFKMMEYARQNGVIPNYTCHGLDMTPEYADKTAKLCGAVAVSLVKKQKTYDTIKMLTDRRMNQINIHYMLSEETYERAFKIVDDISSDPRLEKFNAIVFLQYKSKGRNPDGFNSVLDVEKYKKLTAYCDEKGVRYGFDSCSAPIYVASIQESENKEQLEMFVEPCESGLFSSYINCRGEFYVCSFAEGEDTWVEGLDVLHCDNFLKDIWYHPRLIAWRSRLLENKRSCPIYDLSLEEV